MAATSLIEGDYVMTAADFRRIAAELRAASGIVLNDTKATLVYSRLSKRLRQLGLTRFRDYCALLDGGDGHAERVRMLSALTTNLTRFFREPHHFEHLRTAVLPTLIPAARRGGRLRFWSAACSNGAEAYSIAMVVLEAFPDAADHDVKVLATDVDPQMVEAAARGIYDASGVDGVPPALRQRWMTKVGKGNQAAWSVAEPLRRMVSCRRLNLLAPWPMERTFEVIFCRNVCIYFDEPTQDQLWARLAGQLSPAGVLYIGHSERIGGQAQHQLRNIGNTTYGRAGDPA